MSEPRPIASRLAEHLFKTLAIVLYMLAGGVVVTSGWRGWWAALVAGLLAGFAQDVGDYIKGRKP